jgi:hypothetical protein
LAPRSASAQSKNRSRRCGEKRFWTTDKSACGSACLRSGRGDRNVNERLAYEYPPTFQPGYVGQGYFGSGVRIVVLGQNPGEGSQPDAVARDGDYRAKLEAFARGDTLFEDVNRLVASDMLGWGSSRARGIFRESGAARTSLLDDDVRPSIEDVGYVNAFPSKTSGNVTPLSRPCGGTCGRRT